MVRVVRVALSAWPGIPYGLAESWHAGRRSRTAGSALLRRAWWPDDGWQRGTAARLCPRGAFSHVVAYTRQTSALRGTADTRFNAASYGSRWVLLSRAPAAGVARALRPRVPRPPV